MNCNITLNYTKEFRRMCHSYHACKGCPLLHDMRCLQSSAVNAERIAIVQEWSDTHPETVTIMNETVTYVNPDLPSNSKEWTSTTKTDSIQYSPLNLELLKK